MHPACSAVNKRIRLVAEDFLLKIHQNTTDYTYVVDVSVSIGDLHQRKKLVPASSSDEGLKRQQHKNSRLCFDEFLI